MDLGHINLRLLRIFDMIYRERNLTAAGERLGLSQSAVSHALSNLRAIFSDELFVRTSEGMAPTVRAMSIGERLPEALTHLEEAVFGDRFNPESTTRTFTIACSDYTSVILVPHLASRFHKAAPNGFLRIVPREERLLADLDSGKLDIIIAGLTAAPERMAYEELFLEDLSVTSRADHPVAGKARSIDDILAYGMVGIDFNLGRDTYKSDYSVRQGQMTLWNNTRFRKASEPGIQKANFDIVVPNFHSALHILKTTNMFADIPRRLSMLYASELRVWDEFGIFKGGAQCQMWHSIFGNQPAVTWLRQMVRDAANDAIQMA